MHESKEQFIVGIKIQGKTIGMLRFPDNITLLGLGKEEAENALKLF